MDEIRIGSTSCIRERPKVKRDNTNSSKTRTFSCKYCESEYTHKTNLYRHIRHLHKSRDDLPIKEPAKVTIGKFVCSTCKEEFKTSSLLSFHQALIHPVRKGKLVITCSICTFSGSKSELLAHYVDKHNVKIEIEEHNFRTPLEFLVWKSNVERDTLTQYAKRQKHHVLVNGVIIDMLYCHRDGFYRPEGKNLRNLKVKGTNKINGYCPALIKVMTYVDEHVSVLFLKTHVGHGYELDRLTLSREERDSIAAKIAIGITFDEILAELQSSKHERLRIMTRKDLYNIEASYNLNSGSVRGRQPKTENILEEHKAALKIPRNFVSLENDHWNVKSCTKDIILTETVVKPECNLFNCSLKCPICECCAHNSNCSCTTHSQKVTTTCEHKHVVHQVRKNHSEIIMQTNFGENTDCPDIVGDLLEQNNFASSSSTIDNSGALTSPILLDNCPQLTALVIQDLPSNAAAETTTIFVPPSINERKAVIRGQLAGILQAVESSDLEEELQLIQSLLEPIVQTVQTMNDTEEIIVPEVVQPVCKQLKLDDNTQFFTASSDTDTPIIAGQLQVDQHNNPILITYTLNDTSQ